MKIAVDCRALTSVKTGGGYYTENLLKALIASDKKNKYLLCAHRPFDFPAEGGNVKKIEGGCFSGLLWQNAVLPRVLAREKAALLHSPLFTLPFSCGCPGIITVFDLTPVLFPEFHRAKVRFSFLSLKRSAAKARKIIAISEQTKKDLVTRMGVEEGKISVIYPAAAREFRPAGPEEKKRVKEKYAGGNDYLLHVGTLEPRKNLEFLIDVFMEMIIMGRDNGVNLLLVGAKGWKYASIFDRIAEYGLRDRVFWAGYAEFSDLPALYSGAEVFVYPSLYEGFGLPIVEALACGAPSVASAVSSIPEVLGDAGVLIKGWNQREWAAGISLLLEDRSTRDEFSRRGMLRSGKFSWSVCAEKTLELYNLFR